MSGTILAHRIIMKADMLNSLSYILLLQSWDMEIRVPPASLPDEFICAALVTIYFVT